MVKLKKYKKIRKKYENDAGFKKKTEKSIDKVLKRVYYHKYKKIWAYL